MFSIQVNNQKEWLKANYFRDPNKVIHLAADEVLLQQGRENRRIYLVREGSLKGRVKTAQQTEYEMFMAKPGDFVGINSFFHPNHLSLSTTIAIEDCVLSYMDEDTEIICSPRGDTLEQQYMGVILEEWSHRQFMIHHLHKERESMITHMMEVRRMASLGELSAGIAHELNNALSVLSSASRSIYQIVVRYLTGTPKRLAVFEESFQSGRILSSREMRDRQKALQKFASIDETQARQLARTSLRIETIEELIKSGIGLQEIVDTNEIGLRLHDMELVSKQSAHVIQSMRTLGAPKPGDRKDTSIRAVIQNSLHLLSADLKEITVETMFCDPDPVLYASPTELVQVFVNLIKNARDALIQDQIKRPMITIGMESTDSEILISICDNALGISAENLPNIFSPSFTTKKMGLEFGLGLGLGIVKKIVQSYDGRIEVESSNIGSRFTVHLPKKKCS
ncbi:MAG: cyclic nucleotide-binding domain-containing protein [Candidatus Cloacimonetes bacterium]|nr:cyclic nucleotide-binding domain-containing protein [Candidatus Cloacimonadota bacterium]